MKNLLIICISVLMAACGSNKNTEITTEAAAIEQAIVFTDAQVKNIGVTMGRVEKKSMSSVLKVNGKIDVPPQNMVSVSAPLGGYLKSTQLLPGMKIKKGEVIAILEDPQYIQLQQDYLVAKTKLVFAENEFNRQKELNASKASSDKVFQQVEADFRTQKIAVKALNEKLKLLSINPENLNENNLSRSISMYAPIDGYVSAVNVNIGKYVAPADVLFELVNPTDIHLALTIFEKDVNKLFVGQKLKAYTNNQPEKKHNCEILLISQDLSADRSVMVHCHFNDYDKSLIPGMYMNAEIEIKSNDAYVLPQSAVVSFEGKDYVFVEKGKNSFEMIEVQTGVLENDFIEIVSPQKITNANVVVKGAYSILMAIKNKSEE